MFESLQYRNFRLIWAGSFISFMAMNMQMITRGWLVVELRDASPFALALVMVTFAVPSTVSSLIGGALADRFPKKYLIITSQTGNFLMTLLLGLLNLSGHIEFWHVLAVGVVNGTMMGINSNHSTVPLPLNSFCPRARDAGSPTNTDIAVTSNARRVLFHSPSTTLDDSPAV